MVPPAVKTLKTFIDINPSNEGHNVKGEYSTMYTEEELLMLSGIQHYAFCPRQWALIHLEQVWEENELTISGQILHTKVNDPEQSERRGSLITLRSVPLASFRLGVYGVSDVVELRPSVTGQGYIHPRYPGCWEAKPVEYKRGAPKRRTNADKLQLCAEAMALEEMYDISIPSGDLYYGETRHRLEVEFDDELRELTEEVCRRMHETFRSRILPDATPEPKCRSCSLKDICMPALAERGKVMDYFTRNKLFGQ